GSKLHDNVEGHGKGFSKPKNGNTSIYDNISISKIADAGFRNYAEMDIRTDNQQILSKFPTLNEVYEKVGIKTDAYRIRTVTRAESGGLENRSAAGNKAYEDAVNR
ncbi:hypothetical protein JZU68_03465, partial [bacterium]|nr:hypothetical protein [bacterium]